MRRPIAVALAVLALGAAACDAPEHGRPPRLWTLFDLYAAAKTGGSVATGPTFPTGLPAGTMSGGGLLAVAGGELADHRTGAWTSPALKPSLAFADGKPAVYYTTEVWTDHDEVWVQPMYVLVTAWDEKSPKDNRLKDASGKIANPVFSIGLWRDEGESAFWSPFWQIFYAEVPAGTPLDKYRSQKQILDDKLELHPGPGKVCAMEPHELVQLAIPDGALTPVRPWFRDEVTAPLEGEGWVDGRTRTVWYWDFGNDRFTWDPERRVVKETPLYLFFTRGKSGDPEYVGLPNVGGSAGGQVPGGKPNFGALWRMHSVMLPAAAAVLVPSKLAQLKDETKARWPNVPDLDPAIEARPDIDDHTLKVLLKPDCLADPAKFPAGCDFLDSEAAIRNLVAASSIRRTEVMVDCPLMYLGGKVPL